MAVLASAALGIFAAESQIPPILPVPGVKLGLANIITLVTMCILGKKEAAGVLAVRVLLGCLFAGSVSSLMFSAAGGAAAYAVMALTVGVFSGKYLWICAVLGALAHNAAQIAVAVAVTGTEHIIYYALILIPAAIITGAFTGVVSVYIIKGLDKYTDSKKGGR